MKLLFITLLSSIFSISVHAQTVADIEIADTVSHSSQSAKLILNGAGIRTKFIFDIYIGSLYLEKKQLRPNEIYIKYHGAKEVFKAPGEKRISMHFLYDEISKEKLVSGWNDGFENNLSKDELIKFKNQINQFNNLFVAVKKGDVINLNFIPNTGTYVVLNEKSKGLVKGDDFFIALLKIWLGDEPADSDLKEAMLGSG
ncbi:MAG: chalcone isomerase family protein [Gammaproteobacteria bacterium]|nr:chalcone isomerase family protein [Gammaproteobacteria bacterium]